MLSEIAKRFRHQIRASWANVVRLALIELGGEAGLKDIYSKVFALAPERMQTNHNIEAKVRHTLQLGDKVFARVEPGRWRLAA
jgi:hypothetical protein